MITQSAFVKRVVSLLALMTFLPIVGWFSILPEAARFESVAQALTSIGQLTAIAGTVLFSLALLLRARFSPRIISHDNMTVIKKVRKTAELIAALLLLSHPILLAVKLTSTSFLGSAEFFIPHSDWAFNFGIYALLLLLSYYLIRLLAGKEGKLNITPLVLGTILFLGTLHAFFMPTSLSENILLKSYVLGLAAAAVLVQVPALFIQRRKTVGTANNSSA